MAGGVFTGANPGYVSRELAYQISDSGARFLIATDASLDVSKEAARAAGLKEDSIFYIDDGFGTIENRTQPINGIRHWTTLVASKEDGAMFRWEDFSSTSDSNTTIVLNYSSGTTGVPKGVEITHRNYVANSVQTRFIAEQDPEYQNVNNRAKWICYLPMYHAMAQTIYGITAPLRQIPVYIMPKFDFLAVLDSVQKYRITDLFMVPPIVVAMAKSPVTRKFDLSSVENVTCGAAPLGREMCAELEKLWPNGRVNVKQGWGMTEVTCTATTWYPGEVSDSSAVGELVPNAEARIVDEEGIDLRQGERGELWIKAPNVMKGYWQKPDATRETISNGWLKTGDIAYADEHNKFFIVDRMKELIKVKGFQVAPAELEALLLEHPAVADAAVIGVTMNGEEAPRAYIVPTQGANARADDIVTFLNSKVSKAKRLSGGVKFVDQIPKNPSGKILRKALRELMVAEAKDEKTKARL